MNKKVLSLGITLIIVGLLLPYALSELAGAMTRSFTVSPLSAITVSRHLNRGERVEGYFTVRGGNDDIKFYIKDPYGVIIYDVGKVKGRHDFVFTAETIGVYTLYFDNSFSLITSKHIYLTIKLTPAILGLPINQLLIMLGLIVSVIGVVLKSKTKE